MSRNDNLFDEYNIVDDNPDLHPDDNFFMKSPPAVKFELEDDLMEVRHNDEFGHEVANTFPTQVDPEDIIENIVRFHSLPHGVDETELASVFQRDIPDLSPDDAILIKLPSGKPTGTAFLNLGSKEEVLAVLRHNGSSLRGRLLMMVPSTEREMEKCQEQAEKNEPINPAKPVHAKSQQIRSQCVHMKGVCLTSNHNAVRRFFEPIRIPSQSVYLIPRQSGASSLEAYVQFRDTDDCESALSKHRSQLDGCEVEVNPVSKNQMLDAIEVYGVLDKGPNPRRPEYVDSNIIDARLKARQEILKDRTRERSRSPLYRSSLLSRDREVDTLSRLQEMELMRDRDRHRDRDDYDRERRGDTDRKELSSLYGTKRERLGDSLRSRYYSREDDKGLDTGRYSSREDEYQLSPHSSKRLSRRSPYSDRLPSSSGRSRDIGSYSSEFSKNPTLRLTGIPSETLIYDIIDFFHGFDLKIDSIRIQCNDYGMPNGKAFVRFPSFSQAMLAIDQCKSKGLGSVRSIDMTLI